MTMQENQSSRSDLPDVAWVAALAREAGELTLRYFRRELKIDEKSGDLGLVTEADLASEAFLKAKILGRFPEHTLLGEETGWNKAAAEGQVVWVVDPIDGTTNFSKGNPFYCVSVACGCIQNGRFVPERVAIAHPASGDVYAAARGQGAQVNGSPLKVGAGTDMRRWSVATGFSSNKGESLHGVMLCIEEMQNKILGMRINGAAALDLALTARGIFNGFFESRLSPWDMAAGQLLVEEAGGVVLNYEGRPFDALQDKHIVAGPAHVVDELLSLIFKMRGKFKSNVWP
jgi:myo-inositol-1(or 4)-monophosphatase